MSCCTSKKAKELLRELYVLVNGVPYTKVYNQQDNDFDIEYYKYRPQIQKRVTDIVNELGIDYAWKAKDIE